MSNAQILVVEDEILVAMDISDKLTSLGYSVAGVVSSGKEAVRQTEEKQPDLVVMDIVLEGDMDGIEAAEQIRARSHAPVVYLTAYADKDTLERAKITEPFGYILKPFTERDLHVAIEIALYQHKVQRELEQRVRELTALNEMFQQHLKERFEVVETFRTLLKGLQKLAQDTRQLAEQAKSHPLPDLTDLLGLDVNDGGTAGED